MTDVLAKELRDAASRAHRRGDGEAAIGLFKKIVDLFPDTPEAVDAVFYLSGIGKARRRPSERVSAERRASAEKREAPIGGFESEEA